MNNAYLVTVVASDRPGVVRDVSRAIFDMGGNLLDVRQTIVGGVFVLNATASFASAGDDVRSLITTNVLRALAADKPDVCVRPVAGPEQTLRQSQENYVLAVTGSDKPGRVYNISSILASYGVNIEDWRYDSRDLDHALSIGLVKLPDGVSREELESALRKELSPMGLTTSLRHENIFRATNEVGPIAALLGE